MIIFIGFCSLVCTISQCSCNRLAEYKRIVIIFEIMGAALAKMMQNPRMQQDRMHACLKLMHKVLLSQIATLAV